MSGRFKVNAAVVCGFGAFAIALTITTAGGKIPSMMLAIITALVIALAAGFLVWAVLTGVGYLRSISKPSLTAAQVAEHLHLRYQKKSSKHFRVSRDSLPEIRNSSSITHLMKGVLGEVEANRDSSADDRRVVIFQSTYMIYTGQATVPVSHTIYETDAPNWPTMRIVPRQWYGRLLRRWGLGGGLELENAEFNSVFKVVCEDEDFAIALLTPAMQRFMLEKPAVRWYVRPGRIFLIYSGTLKPDRVEQSLHRMQRFWSLIPRELENWPAQ